MKMKISEASALLSALSALDGYERVIKEGGNEKSVRDSYKLGPARLTIARNIRALREVVEDFQRAQNALIIEESGGTGSVDPKTNPEGAARVAVEIQKMVETEHAIALLPISEADLKLDVNPIPPSVLASLIVLFPEAASE